MAHSSASRRTARLLAASVATAVVLGTPVASASAATTAAVSCSTRTTGQKFLKVDGDSSAYFTAPSGTFESGTSGWSLTNASVASGNEPFFVNGAGQSKSLQVNPSGRAVSPLFCNQYGERSIRFFYKGTSGAHVHLHIDVSNASTSNRSTLDWEIQVPAGGWGAANGIMVPDLYSQGYENLQLTFTAPVGSVQVDDVEIDPWKSM